jgi:succinate dehydrogenase / fumarate reductase membrane anchor subunit
MSFKSPLNRVIGLGTAKEGASHWWHQRLTAVAMLPLGLWFAFSVLGVDLGSHAALVGWIGDPMTAVLLILTAACLIYHSFLGVRVVAEDYIAAKSAKIVVLSLSAFAHAFLGVVCLISILKIALGTG